MSGWIKLHRELMDKSIWQLSNPVQKVILNTLMMMASHTENQWEWQGKKFTVQPGQLVTSAASIERNCGKGVTRQHIRTALKRFDDLGFLTIESTKTGCLITIVNWGLYQGEEEQPNQTPNQDLTKSQPTSNQDLTTIKNVKNDKNVRMKERYINIVSSWNSLGLTKLTSIGGTREKSLNARINEHGEEEVLRAINSIKDSDFLKGQNNNNWIITFDWLIKPNNFVKVLEGNYSAKQNHVKQSRQKKTEVVPAWVNNPDYKTNVTSEHVEIPEGLRKLMAGNREEDAYERVPNQHFRFYRLRKD